MPRPTPNQLHQFRAYTRRQQLYEKRYQKYFYAYLRENYNDVAREVREKGLQEVRYTVRNLIDNERLEKILTRLFEYVTIEETKIAYLEVLEPVEGQRLQKKDIIDDLAGILSGEGRGLINVWRSLLDQFLQVRLTNRITQINNTTNERISRIIEAGMFDGKGQEEIAREIRRKGRRINANRSRAIARTETVVAANQGKFLAAKSSNLEMEKKWIPAKDNRTRRSHLDMLGREWIDLDDKFWLANEAGLLEEALYPGDSTLSASNTINCRCALVFQPKRDERGNLIRKS